MKLLLHTDITRLGYVGDVVEVSDGYARNYLLPQKLAVKPTQANIKAVETEKAQQAELRRLAREALVKVAEKVNGARVTLRALANEQGHLFGSVGGDDVAQSLRDQGYEVQARQIMWKEHIRQLGNYEVKLRFADDIEAEIQVEVIRPETQGDDDESDSESPSE